MEDYYISKAISVSYKSNCTHKHGAIIVDRCTGRIVAKGYNRICADQKHLLSVHAEMDALRKIRSFYTKYNNLAMYIIRFDNNQLKYSKPCITCATNIKRFGIKKIYFSFQDDYVDRIKGYHDKNYIDNITRYYDKNIKINSDNDISKYFRETSTTFSNTY
jgi:deoxycytidylate deaminase